MQNVTVKNEVPVMKYLEWNNLIARHFFNEENAGREVLLYVNDEILGKIGKNENSGIEDFIESVKKGPPWASRSGFCQKALQSLENWRDKDFEYPPYISYLAFFVLAAGTHGDFAPHAYYPRLGKLLDENGSMASLPSFDKMILLWDDLEKWSAEDKHEELGRFVARIRGGWWKVGLPLSQTIVSKDEQKRLPELFEKAGLDPSSPPSPQILLKLMRCYGEGIFERRTQRVLNIKQGQDAILKNKLIEMVLDELEEWDGSVQSEEAGEEQRDQKAHRINSNLRICIRYDPLSCHVNTSVRLKANRAYPEDGLIFKCSQFPGTFVLCEESHQGWSKKLKRQESEMIDGTAFDWLHGACLEDRENKWKASLKGSPVRLFVSGTSDGLTGWVETNRLNRSTEFLLLTYGDTTSKVIKWGKASCDSFTGLKASGLPPGWSLSKGQNASDSCDEIDILTISSSARLLLRGGVKVRPGNTYLYSSPPKIVLENISGDEEVTVNGRQLIIDDKEMHVWKLPKSVQPGEILRIEAKTGEDELRKVIRLEEYSVSNSLDDAPWYDMKGRIVHGRIDCARIRGALVEEPCTERTSCSFRMKPAHSTRLIFIGNVPGQISRWPAEPLPSDFEPVWLIEKTGRKKWKVSCYRNSINSVPLPETTTNYVKKRDIREWKEYVWVRRKKIKGHRIPSVRQKWREFSEAAKNV